MPTARDDSQRTVAQCRGMDAMLGRSRSCRWFWIIVGSHGHDGRLGEVVLWRRRLGLPFQARGTPGIRAGFAAEKKRPREVTERERVADAENRRARAREHVERLEFRRIDMIAPRHPEIAE